MVQDGMGAGGGPGSVKAERGFGGGGEGGRGAPGVWGAEQGLARVMAKGWKAASSCVKEALLECQDGRSTLHL